MKILALSICLLMLSSCVTGPCSIAWRSNSSLQYATLDGKAENSSQNPAVNADKKTELDSAVNTSSGSATTGTKNGATTGAKEDTKNGE